MWQAVVATLPLNFAKIKLFINGDNMTVSDAEQETPTSPQLDISVDSGTTSEVVYVHRLKANYKWSVVHLITIFVENCTADEESLGSEKFWRSNLLFFGKASYPTKK